jgi:hypothetical protein
MVITICASVSFYRQAIAIQERLQQNGFTVLMPQTAEKMKQSGDFDVSHYKTWFADAGDYGKKAELIRAHFEKVARGDAVLVLNYEKHGVANYIGGNVLMEMALAFWLRKPIFILNEIPEESTFEEEIKGMMPVVLHGDIDALKPV